MAVLSGLERAIEWTLRKTKAERRDSMLVKGLEFSLQLVSYAAAGHAPGEIQERACKKAGIDVLKPAAYAICYTIISGAAKYFFGDFLEDIPLMGYFGRGVEWWALIGNTISIGARAGYVAIRKRPIGSLTVEGIYYLLPDKITKKYGKKGFHRY